MLHVMAEAEMSAFVVHEEVGKDEDHQDRDAEQHDDQQEVRLVRLDLFNLHAGFDAACARRVGEQKALLRGQLCHPAVQLQPVSNEQRRNGKLGELRLIVSHMRSVRSLLEDVQLGGNARLVQRVEEAGRVHGVHLLVILGGVDEARRCLCGDVQDWVDGVRQRLRHIRPSD